MPNTRHSKCLECYIKVSSLGPSWSFLVFLWDFSEQKVLTSLKISALWLHLNKLTIIRIQVRLLADEEEGDQGEGDQIETEAVASGQASSSRSRG